MPITTSLANSLLNAAFRGQAYNGGVIKMGLFRNGLPSASGVEVSGGGYARQTLTFSAASGKEVVTSTKAVFNNLPTSQTVVAYGIYSGTTLIAEDMLTQPFKAGLDTSSLEIGYSTKLGA